MTAKNRTRNSKDLAGRFTEVHCVLTTIGEPKPRIYFTSIAEAASHLNMTRTALSNAIAKGKHQAKGLVFEKIFKDKETYLVVIHQPAMW